MVRRRKSNPIEKLASGRGERQRRKPARRRSRGSALADVGVFAAVLAAAAFFAWALLLSDGRITVYVKDGSRTLQYLTEAATVGELLSSVGKSTGSDDSVSAALDSQLEDGETVEITRAYPVAVQSGGNAEVMYMSSGTVGDALDRAGIAVKSGDEVSELTFRDVEPGLKINHTSVDISYKVSYKTLDYDEIIKKDDKEYESFKKVEVEGKDGKKQITQRITVKDGVEVSREVVDQIVTEEAVDQVIRVGTKIRYQTSFKGETRRWKEAPTDGVNGWKSMKVDKITAYCTGTRTATGTKPNLGTIAVNTYYFKYGTQIYVRGYGYGTARDTGAFRNYKNSKGEPMNQLDLWFNSESEAKRWGTKYNVTIWYK